VKVKSLFLIDGTTDRPAIDFQIGAAKIGFISTSGSLYRRIAEGVESGIAPVPIAVPWNELVPDFIFRTITPPAL